MNIAICEDQQIQIQHMLCFLQKRPEHTVEVFGTGKALINRVSIGNLFDIILLDIHLPDILGTQLAEELHRSLPTADIVFTSSFPKYVTDAFNLKVSQFLLKPFSEHQFLTELDRIVTKRQNDTTFWCIKSKDGLCRLSPGDIIYVESYYRRLKIQTTSQLIECSSQIKDAEAALLDHGFYRCHQGFLVNMRYIKQIGATDVLCDQSFTVPISVRKRHQFLNAYMKYIAATRP